MEIIILLILLAILTFAVIYFIIPRRRTVPADEEHYIKALNYLVEDNYKMALKELLVSVRNNTHNIDAYLKLGEIFRKMGKAAKAKQIHKELTTRVNLSASQKEEIYINIVKDYMALNQYDKAMETVEKKLKSAGGNTDYLLELIKAMIEKKEWENAYQLQLRFDKLHGKKNNIKLAYMLAEHGKQIFEEEKSKEKAVEKFKYAIQLHPKCFPAYLYWGDTYFSKENGADLDEALSKWEKILWDMPRASFLVHKKIEKAYFDKNKFDAIIPLYEKVVDKNRFDNKTLLALANLYYKMQEIDLAIEKCRQIIKNNLYDFNAHEFLLKIFMKLKKYDEVYQEIQTIKELFFSKKNKFTCSACGHTEENLFFFCTNCGELYTSL